VGNAATRTSNGTRFRVSGIVQDRKRLDEIEARLKAATPGPWEADEDGQITHSAMQVAIVFSADDFPCADPDETPELRGECEANIALVAHAPDDIAYLLKLVRGIVQDTQGEQIV
jgi:hypothetical protein